MDIFVARQPIFNRNREVIAYELLYRDSDQNFFSGDVTSDVATSILLMNSYLNFGLEHLVGEHKAFVNFDEALIMNDIPHLLDKDRVVIELLEDIVPTKIFFEKVVRLKAEGYTIAIDDFVEDYAYTNLVDFSHIIKVEFMGETRTSIENIVRTWKPKGKLLLAEKVETIEEFEWAKSIGFDYFQGYFFAKPAMVKSKGLNDSASQYVRLMNEMNVDEPDYKHIAAIIEVDVALTYKILKLVNSKVIGTNQITSIQHALSILGIKSMRKWISLAMVQSQGTKETSELIITAMVRSHLLESIAMHSSLKHHVQELTLIGILSILDVILEKPMEELIDSLPLMDSVKDTLLGKKTTYSCAYNLCLNYEKGDFTHLDDCSSSINYDINSLPKQYIDAVKWADVTYAFMYSEL